MLIKKKRLDEAEKKLKEAKELLENEKKTLKALEDEAQKTLDHKMEKVKQLDEEMDEGTTSDKIEVAKKYLETVEEDLVRKKRKVEAQVPKVEAAKKHVEESRQNMLKKQQDVEKLNIHRKEWEKEAKYEIRQKEAIEQDEIGTAKYTSLKREQKAHEEYIKKQKKRKG